MFYNCIIKLKGSGASLLYMAHLFWIEWFTAQNLFPLRFGPLKEPLELNENKAKRNKSIENCAQQDAIMELKELLKKKFIFKVHNA